MVLNLILGAPIEECESLSKSPHIFFCVPQRLSSNHVETPTLTKLIKELDPIENKSWVKINNFIGSNRDRKCTKALTSPCIPSLYDMHIDICMGRIPQLVTGVQR